MTQRKSVNCELDFHEALNSLRDTGFNPVPDRVHFVIPDAPNVLLRGINYFTENKATWLKEYDEVAEWLSNNLGRGLFCYGNCGRGKTLICCKIIPILLNHYCRKIVTCYSAEQMNANLDALLQKHIQARDDIETENYRSVYGSKRLSFAEVCDETEKKGKLLIVTTNLTLTEIREKYGERTMDRLVATTRLINFKGDSLRS